MRVVTARYSVAAAVLCAWACAKTNDQATGDDSFTPTPGKGGSTATSGGNGGTLGTGGSVSPGSGGASTGSGASGGSDVGGSTSGGSTGGGAVPGSGGSSASGGASAMAGNPGTGGGVGTGGSVGSGGSVGAGGSVGSGATGGVTGSGGMSSTGAGGSGTGGSSYMWDPTFKPPDMTKFAKIVVLYQAGQTAKSATNIQFSLLLKNQTDAAYPMGTVTVRYWMSAEPAPMTALDYAAQNLSCKGAPKFVTNHTNSYLEFSFGTAGSLPPSTDQNAANEGNVNGRVQSGVNNENFDQSNDWSFSAAANGMQPNPKITVYDGTTLIWGCEPTEVCATADTTGGGEAGAGGAPAL